MIDTSKLKDRLGLNKDADSASLPKPKRGVPQSKLDFGEENEIGKTSDLGVRFLAGLVYFVITAACLLISDVTCVAYLAFISGFCAFEFYRMMKHDDKLVNEWLGTFAAASFPILVYLLDLFGIIVACSLFVLALMAWYVALPKVRIIDLCLTLFGVAYMGIPLSSLILIRMDVADPWGGVLLLALFTSVWFGDVGAYLVGRQFGKHKMAPKISPKKSWEGFFGGVVAVVLVWCAMTQIPGLSLSFAQAVPFGLICGGVGVLGDLAESRIKRNVGVKDSGRIMPGHGGMFDRNDSLLAVSLAASALLYLGGCFPSVVL